MKKWSKLWKADKKELEKVVLQSSTMTEVLSHFGMCNKGNNTLTLRSRLDFEKIDYSHIPLGRYANKGIARGGVEKKSLDEILVRNSSYNRFHLKRRLLDAGLLKNKCYACPVEDKWNGQKLVLVLDHINGDSKDNRLNNLRMLCPNCNSQQPTFCKGKI